MALTRPTTQTQAAPVDDDAQLTDEGVQATAAAAAPEAEVAPEAPAETAPEAPAETAPEAPAETAPEAPAAVAAAPQSPGTAVAAAPTSRALAGTQEMADDGMEGLTLGGMSFEQIRLPAEGQFLIGQEDVELGKSFQCVVQASRARYVVRQSDDRDADLFYSYDASGRTNAEGLDMSEKLQDWKEDGYDKPVIKKYVEVMAILLDDGGERDRMMVTLSIPPASEQKFAGFIYQQRMMKRLKQNEFITECYVGKKVKGKSGDTFFPWGFRNAGPAPELF